MKILLIYFVKYRYFWYFKVANDAGDFFPIWATCLGFEFITLASSDKERHLARYSIP